MVEREGGDERNEDLSDDDLFEQVLDDSVELNQGIGDKFLKAWLGFNTESGPKPQVLSNKTPVYFHAEPPVDTSNDGSPSLSVFYKISEKENQGFKSRLFTLDPRSIIRQGVYALDSEDVGIIAGLAQNRTKNFDKQRYRIVEILNKRIPPTS